MYFLSIRSWTILALARVWRLFSFGSRNYPQPDLIASCYWPFTVISLKRNASSFQYAQNKDWLPLKQVARSWADRNAVVTRKECSTRTASKLKNISSWDYLCGGFEPLSTRNRSGLLVTRPIDTLSGKIQSCFNRGRDGVLLLKPPSLSASIS